MPGLPLPHCPQQKAPEPTFTCSLSKCRHGSGTYGAFDGRYVQFLFKERKMTGLSEFPREKGGLFHVPLMLGLHPGTQRRPLQTNPPCEGHGPLTFTFTSQRVTDRCLRGAQARRLQPEHLQRRHGSKHAGGALQESRAHGPSHGTAPGPGPAWIARRVCPAVPDTLQRVACFPGEAVKA